MRDYPIVFELDSRNKNQAGCFVFNALFYICFYFLHKHVPPIADLLTRHQY